MGNRRRWRPSGKYRTSFGNASSLSSWRKTRPRPGAASALTPDRCSMASSSACAAGANGTDCRKSLGTTAPFIAPFNGGWRRVSCTECGEPLWRGAKSWVAWTGNGSRQTEPWARHVLGGPDWAQPDGPWQGWYQGSLLVDGEGGPLSIVVAGANVHDAKLLEATLDAIVVERPQPTEEEPQHLCLDKGYDNPSGRGAAAEHGYREHIRRIGEEKLDASGDKRYPARRWVVERTLAWLSKCRAVLVRYDKKAANYLGVLQLACALLWFRRQWRLAILR